MNKKNKKGRASGILLLLFVILGAVVVITLYPFSFKKEENKKEPVKQGQNNNNQEEEKVSTYYIYNTVDVEVKDGSVYVFDNVVYSCNEVSMYSCYEHQSNEFFYQNKDKRLIILGDDGETFIYDYENQKKLFSAEDFEFVIIDDVVAYIIYVKDGKYGILNQGGEVILEASYEYIDSQNHNKEVIVVSKDNEEENIVNLSTGKVLLDKYYKSIKVYDNYYVLKDSSATLVNKDLDSIIKGSFEDILVIEELQYALVLIKDEVYMYELNGTKVSNNTIEIDSECKITTRVDNNELKIIIEKGNSHNEYMYDKDKNMFVKLS